MVLQVATCAPANCTFVCERQSHTRSARIISSSSSSHLAAPLQNQSSQLNYHFYLSGQICISFARWLARRRASEACAPRKSESCRPENPLGVLGALFKIHYPTCNWNPASRETNFGSSRGGGGGGGAMKVAFARDWKPEKLFRGTPIVRKAKKAE